MSIESFREGRYELISLGDLACLNKLFVRCILITPSEVLGDRSGEQLVLLENDRDGVS